MTGSVGRRAAPGWTAAETAVLADPRWSVDGWHAVGVVTLAADSKLLVGDPASPWPPELVDGPLTPGVWVWQVRWDPWGSPSGVRLVNSTVVPSDWVWTEPPTLPAGIAGELSYTGRRVNDSGELGWLVSPTAAGVAAIPAPEGAKGPPYDTQPYTAVSAPVNGIEGAWLWRHDDDVDLGCPTYQGAVKMFRAGSILLTFGEVDVDSQIAARAVDGLVVEVQADLSGADEDLT